LDLTIRDMDVPLSQLGLEQGVAVGAWFARLPADKRPTAMLVSPYVRAVQTADLIRVGGGLDADVDVRLDERLREREFGILDGLTRAGIVERYPDQAAARTLLGKFWHRPPGGESWADVALRLRSLLDSVGRELAGERVVVVTHQVVILVARYLLERLTEEEILAIDRQGDLGNCSVTTFDYDPGAGRQGAMKLGLFNDVSPVARADKPVTAEPDAPRGLRG
jgi:broad specificity phosphatase PhoE